MLRTASALKRIGVRWAPRNAIMVYTDEKQNFSGKNKDTNQEIEEINSVGLSVIVKFDGNIDRDIATSGYVYVLR